MHSKEKNKNTTITSYRVPVLSILNAINLHKSCVENNFTEEKNTKKYLTSDNYVGALQSKPQVQ